MNYAIVCLDETGSMRGQEHRVVTSLNEYVAALPEHTMVTVFKFDSNRWTTYFDNYKKNWPSMLNDDYKPGAMTPLLDCIAKTVHHAESVASEGDKVFIMIDTDGQENASTEETVDSVKALIDQKKALNWEFWFMANGIDEVSAMRVGQTGHNLGMNVASNTHRTRVAAYTAQAGSTISYFDDKDATD